MKAKKSRNKANLIPHLHGNADLITMNPLRIKDIYYCIIYLKLYFCSDEKNGKDIIPNYSALILGQTVVSPRRYLLVVPFYPSVSTNGIFQFIKFSSIFICGKFSTYSILNRK